MNTFFTHSRYSNLLSEGITGDFATTIEILKYTGLSKLDLSIKMRLKRISSIEFEELYVSASFSGIGSLNKEIVEGFTDTVRVFR